MIISMNGTCIDTAGTIIIVMICVLLSSYIYNFNAREREKFGFGAIFMSNYCCYFAGFEI